MHFQEGVPLAALSTFKIGGPARFYCVVDTVEGRMRHAVAAMQALPTVLAPIVSIRKEELA